MRKRIMSILLAMVMVFTMLPLPAAAAENDNVYISVSYDGAFAEDANGNAVAYTAVPLSELKTINLDDYGLGTYLYDADMDGNYDITALHLYIYTHEKIFGREFSEVYVTGGPGSIYFAGGLFGFADENLNYFYNGTYPEIDGWGVTADQITLKAGDFLDIAGYSSWAFWMDSAAGFHYFVDDAGNFTHEYNVKNEEELTVKLVRSYSAMGSGAELYEETGYDIYYGTSVGNATGSIATNENGEGTVTLPLAGTWYLWCDGGHGAEWSSDIVSSPAIAIVEVEADETCAHNYTDATCTEPKKCELCGVTEGDALGHDFSSTYTVDKKATFTTNGIKSKHCTRNGCNETTSKTIYKASDVKLSTAIYTYNGKTKNPTVCVKDSKGNTIDSSNYTITKPSGRKNVGKYTYTIKFKNAYSGTKKLTLTINPKGTSISKVTAAKKAFTVKWKKQSEKMSTSRITGYQMQYSTGKKFTNPKTVTISGYSNTSKKITKLSAKKTYYVRVRTYKTINGTKYYSGWSATKSVKTK